MEEVYNMRKPPCKALPHQTKDILSDRTSLFQRGCKGACFPSGQPVTAWLLSVTWLPVTARLLVATLLSVTWLPAGVRSEEHTSALQSLMRISYAVFCLKKK